MKTNVGQKAFDYMMETSGKILKLSEISRESDIGVAEELNIIASNMADFANTILEDGRAREKEIKEAMIKIHDESAKICGVGDKISLEEDDNETAEYLDKIEFNIQKAVESVIGKIDE